MLALEAPSQPGDRQPRGCVLRFAVVASAFVNKGSTDGGAVPVELRVSRLFHRITRGVELVAGFSHRAFAPNGIDVSAANVIVIYLAYRYRSQTRDRRRRGRELARPVGFA